MVVLDSDVENNAGEKKKCATFKKISYSLSLRVENYKAKEKTLICFLIYSKKIGLV